MFRDRKNTPEHTSGGQSKYTYHRQSDAPGKEITQHPGNQTATHPTNRVAADIKPHRERDKTGVNFFTKIGHRHGGNAAKGEANQCSHE
ncbi:Uncharacterised protein [Yersinia enterocolitica]|nr:Uncharacterised protein [Yersinia enterocolitica]